MGRAMTYLLAAGVGLAIALIVVERRARGAEEPRARPIPPRPMPRPPYRGTPYRGTPPINPAGSSKEYTDALALYEMSRQPGYIGIPYGKPSVDKYGNVRVPQ